MPHFIARLLAISGIVSLLTTSTQSAASGNPIVIGQAIDLSGPDAAIGRDYVAGIKTCFDMINSAGGINGRHLQYVVRDDHGNPEVAAKAAGELLERDQVDYLFGGVGDGSTQAIVASPAFRSSGRTLFAPLAASEYPASSRVLFWRPGYQQEVRHVFAHFNKLGVNDVAVFYRKTATNLEAYRTLSTEIRERKMRLTGTAAIGDDGGKIAAEARRLAAAHPGFVMVLADTITTALFLKEYRKLDARTFVAGTSLVNLATLRELAGADAVEWTVFSQVVPDPGTGSSPIQLEHLNMMKKYRDEAVSSVTLEGFVAAKLLVKAIQQSRHPQRSALQDLLARTGETDLGGLSAVISRTGNRLSRYLDIALFRKGARLIF